MNSRLCRLILSSISFGLVFVLSGACTHVGNHHHGSHPDSSCAGSGTRHDALLSSLSPAGQAAMKSFHEQHKAPMSNHVDQAATQSFKSEMAILFAAPEFDESAFRSKGMTEMTQKHQVHQTQFERFVEFAKSLSADDRAKIAKSGMLCCLMKSTLGGHCSGGGSCSQAQPACHKAPCDKKPCPQNAVSPQTT